MWERALPAKGSEAPGRIPETFPSRKPAPGSGVPVQDTLRVHPCKLGRAADRFGHPWPNTVLDGPTRSRRSWEIRRHKPHFVERSRRCYAPWRFRCSVSGAMVVPGGTYLARDGQMRAPRDGLSDPGRHHHCPASRIRSTGNTKPRSPGSCRVAKSHPFAGKARSHKSVRPFILKVPGEIKTSHYRNFSVIAAPHTPPPSTQDVPADQTA